jgi:hypothetical protein
MTSEIIKSITNRVLELVMVEIGQADMQENIRNKIIHPLLFMIYKQLYPYIYGFLAVIFLMFVMLVVLVVFFIIYLKR